MMPADVIPAGVLIREMTVADIPAGFRLCRASGWNQTERDWLFFLNVTPGGALVAVEDGVVIGTVATLPYGPFAWISMVLVDPVARHRGIGTLLLDRGVALVPEAVVARLDATPAGEVVYRKRWLRRGVWPRPALSRCQTNSHKLGSPKPQRSEGGQRGAKAARPLAIADWPSVHEMDTRAFGASRAGLLERLAGEAPEYAWVAERDGRLHGYLLGRHGYTRDQLGPLVADDSEAAAHLLDVCLEANPDREFFLDVPDDQHAWRAELAAVGFAIERPFLSHVPWPAHHTRAIVTRLRDRRT